MTANNDKNLAFENLQSAQSILNDAHLTVNKLIEKETKLCGILCFYIIDGTLQPVPKEDNDKRIELLESTRKQLIIANEKYEVALTTFKEANNKYRMCSC